jgi:hypothetical protein
LFHLFGAFLIVREASNGDHIHIATSTATATKGLCINIPMNSVKQQTTTPKRAAKMASNQSLNHLLNFTLPPRQLQPVQSLPRRSRKPGTHSSVWNKESKYMVYPNMRFRLISLPYRVCERAVSVRNEPCGGLHSAFRRP